MKNIILSLGDTFLAVIATIMFIAVIIIALGTMNQSFILGLMTLVGGTVTVTLLFYFIYILVDIRDNLRAINNKDS